MMLTQAARRVADEGVGDVERLLLRSDGGDDDHELARFATARDWMPRPGS